MQLCVTVGMQLCVTVVTAVSNISYKYQEVSYSLSLDGGCHGSSCRLDDLSA